MKYIVSLLSFILVFNTSVFSQHRIRNNDMIALLTQISSEISSPDNPFSSKTRITEFSNRLATVDNFADSIYWQYLVCQTHLELGEEEKAITIGEQMLHRLDQHDSTASRPLVRKLVAVAYLRQGERINCINGHNAESCIFPIAGGGVQLNPDATKSAIKIYTAILKDDPADWESRWLLNIAYMAIGQYPQMVPEKYLIPGLHEDDGRFVKPFQDVSMQVGLNTESMAGGSIVDDFDNDGFMDVVTSGWGLEEAMHYYKNNGDGTFRNLSQKSGLATITGGLNIQQTDYNNDGLKDIFVLRGAWMGNFGQQPNSLLRNNGDGTFTDVTKASGLLSFHPSQTATWADFNNDGWLDVFIGNETSSRHNPHPCELFINNKNGTFREEAKAAEVGYSLFTKGVTSGDFDNDGDMDLFLSSLEGRKILLKNEGKDGSVSFKDVSERAGLNRNVSPTFSTWFFDYDNDGWLDILCASYDFDKSLAWYAGQEALNMPIDQAGKILVYRNQGKGKFREVSKKLGLNKMVFAMGGNFGDVNNDGFLDMYFGTGNPGFNSLVPNKMFLNSEGTGFADVTSAARVGSLQKGHGVSFADLDNDGDQDIHIEMGGAFPGDAYQNSVFMNADENEHRWIKISLEGTRSNKPAIGAKIRVTLEENGKKRLVYREVNSGGSFGANPLMQHIGTGAATSIEKIEVQWPGSKTKQQFENVNLGEHILIKEGMDELVNIPIQSFSFPDAHPAGSGHDTHIGH